MSPRYVMAFIKHLPPESATVAEIRGGSHFRGWGEDRYMQAAFVNAVRALLYVTTMAYSDPKKAKPTAPTPWPLPDEKYRKKKAEGPVTPKKGTFAYLAAKQLAAARKKKEGGDLNGKRPRGRQNFDPGRPQPQAVLRGAEKRPGSR